VKHYWGEAFTAPVERGKSGSGTARLGVPTQIVGRVETVLAAELVNSLQTAGVRTEHVLVDQAASSGVAAIAVDDTGENQIIVVPGVNGRVDETDVERLRNLLPSACALLLQFEIP